MCNLRCICPAASALEEDDIDSDDDLNPRRKKTVKEPRMKTNKKKSENFFSKANVKNKNRDKSIPGRGGGGGPKGKRQ